MRLSTFLSLSSAIVLTNSMLPAAAVDCQPSYACSGPGIPGCGTCNDPPIGAVRRAESFAYKLHRLLTDRHSSSALRKVKAISGRLLIS